MYVSLLPCLIPVKLTIKQAMFADLIAHGLNKTEAYKRSYEAQGMSDASIRVEACRLSKNPKIVQVVNAIQRTHPKRVVPEVSKDWIKGELVDLAVSPYATTTTKVNALKVLSRL